MEQFGEPDTEIEPRALRRPRPVPGPRHTRPPSAPSVPRSTAAQPARGVPHDHQTGLDGPLTDALVGTRRFFTKVAGVRRQARHPPEGGPLRRRLLPRPLGHDKVVRSTHGVNCTGSCSWKVYVKDGIITWEAQQTDYPSTGADRPEYEPRGCPRGAAFSWYTYSPTRVRYPYVRGVLLEMFREAKAALGDPVVAWASIVQDPEKARRGIQERPRQGRPGALDVGRGRRDRRRRARLHRQALGPGPHRRLLADPGDVAGVLRLGRPLPRAHRRPDALVLRLVRRPAQRLAADVRRPDRRPRVRRLVGRGLPHHVGLERPDDPHAPTRTG
jgi:hypothetical protein